MRGLFSYIFFSVKIQFYYRGIKVFDYRSTTVEFTGDSPLMHTVQAPLLSKFLKKTELPKHTWPQ